MEEHTLVRDRDIEIRPWREDDAEDFCRYACTPAVTRYMNLGFPKTMDDCVKVVGGFAHEDERLQRCRAIVIEGRAVGGLGAFLRGDGTAEVAYWLGEAFHQKGIMSAVLRQFCAELWRDYDLTALCASPFAENIPSQKTLERVGFHRTPEGSFRLEREWSGGGSQNYLC